MWIIALSILVAIVAGTCIYGKKFWENRIQVLGMAAIIMFVSLFTVTLFTRNNLPIKTKVSETYEIHPFYLNVALLKDSSEIPIAKDPKWDFTDVKSVGFSQTVIKDTIDLGNNTFAEKDSLADEIQTTLVLFTHPWNGDTAVGFVQKVGEKWKIDYYSLDDIAIEPITDTADVPKVKKYIQFRDAKTEAWVIEKVIPTVKEFHALFIPQAEYDKLPNSFKCRYELYRFKDAYASL